MRTIFMALCVLSLVGCSERTIKFYSSKIDGETIRTGDVEYPVRSLETILSEQTKELTKELQTLSDEVGKITPGELQIAIEPYLLRAAETRNLMEKLIARLPRHPIGAVELREILSEVFPVEVDVAVDVPTELEIDERTAKTFAKALSAEFCGEDGNSGPCASTPDPKALAEEIISALCEEVEGFCNPSDAKPLTREDIQHVADDIFEKWADAQTASFWWSLAATEVSNFIDRWLRDNSESPFFNIEKFEADFILRFWEPNDTPDTYLPGPVTVSPAATVKIVCDELPTYCVPGAPWTPARITVFTQLFTQVFVTELARQYPLDDLGQVFEKSVRSGVNTAIAAYKPKTWVEWLLKNPTAPILLFSLFLAWVGYKLNAAGIRKRATLDFIDKSLSDEFYRRNLLLFLSVSARPSKADSGTKYAARAYALFQSIMAEPAPAQLRNQVLWHLNQMEVAAIGIKQGIIDERLLRNWICSSYIHYWQLAHPFIHAMRQFDVYENQSSYQSDAYVEFELRAKKWHYWKKNKPSRKPQSSSVPWFAERLFKLRYRALTAFKDWHEYEIDTESDIELWAYELDQERVEQLDAIASSLLREFCIENDRGEYTTKSPRNDGRVFPDGTWERVLGEF